MLPQGECNISYPLLQHVLQEYLYIYMLSLRQSLSRWPVRMLSYVYLWRDMVWEHYAHSVRRMSISNTGIRRSCRADH